MKNTLKKVLFSLGTIGLLGAGSLGMVNAQAIINNQGSNNPTTIGDQETAYNPGAGSDQMRDDNLIKTIRNFINWVLGLLSLIALAICLWGGFQMLTASGDETKYKKGFTILKQAGFGLVVIALAWLIVSVIFRIINKNVEGGNAGSTGTSGD